jgi:hypothetical protein
MSEQLYVVLRDKTRDVDDLKLIQVAIAKKDIGDGITIITAVGYEGGGCYSNFCGVYLMDQFNETVVETLEESDYPCHGKNYACELYDLEQFLYKHAPYEEDENAHVLNKDYFHLIGGIGDVDINFDWDNEAHIKASQNWGIGYKW